MKQSNTIPGYKEDKMDIAQLNALIPWLNKHFPTPRRCYGDYTGEKPEPPKSLIRAKYRVGFKHPKHRA